jgi:beta-phosphoglucomutase-like phosphatase (HAD superfamily)
VILDMDGTLHDTEGVYHAALKQAVSAVGFAITDAFCHSLIGIPGPESNLMIREHLGGISRSRNTTDTTNDTGIRP